MLVEIHHQTTYDYDVPTEQAVLHLLLTPQQFPGQHLVRWMIDVPGIDRAATFVDGFANIVHLVASKQVARRLDIVAEGAVRCEDRGGVVGKFRTDIPPRLFLRRTHLTAPDDAIVELAARISAAAATTLDRLHALMGHLYTTMTFLPGHTHARTTAAEALAARTGVCQDYCHIFLSVARHIGVPARYITGYLVMEGDDTADAHHAWVEAFDDDLGWVAFDAANGICPTERYVRLSCGLDAHGAAPIRGIRQGRSHEELQVTVKARGQAQQ